MDCKKILQVCRIVEEWLKQRKVSNTKLIIMKMLALIMAGIRNPELVFARAFFPGAITECIASNEQKNNTGLEVDEVIAVAINKLITLTQPDPAILGIIYEKLSDDRRKQGVHYTPAEVVKFILSHTVSKSDILINPDMKILDPACGCGVFLFGAYEILWQKYRNSREALQIKYPEKDWSDQGIHCHILEKNLWGIDLDPIAVDITKAGLLLKGRYGNTQKLNVIEQDSLLPFDNKAGFALAAFDYVIGNPPYVSFGLRGTGSLEEEYKNYLKNAFRETAEYKLSYYTMFMQRGIEMLKSGGSLGYIVPDSFLLGRYYSKIRKYILLKSQVRTLAHISCPVFKNASAGYLVICVLDKASDSHTQNSAVNTYQIRNITDLRTGNPACTYSQNYFNNLPHNRFRLFFDLRDKELIEKIELGSSYLRELASGHTGIRSKFTQKQLVGHNARDEKWKRGLISGGQIGRYAVLYQGHWLNIDPDLLYKGGWRDDVIQRRKILVRQTADTLTAAIDDKELYHLNNIHSFVLKNGRITLDYLLIIMNSRLMSYYYHVVSMEYGRSMAQTDIETLELLPVKIDETINVQAIELVKGMTELTRRMYEGDKDAVHKVKVLDEYLDQLVFRIYGLTDQEVQYINDYENFLCKNVAYKYQSRRRFKGSVEPF